MAQTQPSAPLSIEDLCAGKLPAGVAEMRPDAQEAMRMQAAAICAMAKRSAKPAQDTANAVSNEANKSTNARSAQ